MEKEIEVKVELKVTNMEEYKEALRNVQNLQWELNDAIEKLNRIHLECVFEKK